MKGIMLKDLYENFCIPKHLAAYIFGYCVTIICTFLSANQYTFILFTGIVFPILGTCAAEYSTEEDEKSNFTKLQITFPVTKAQIILAKYLLGLVLISFSLLIDLIVSLIYISIFRTITITEMLKIIGLGVGFALIFLAVSYAGFFLLGKHWGTIIFLGFAAVLGGAVGLMISLNHADVVFTCSPLVLLGVLLIGALMTVLSCLLSIAVFKRRYS